MSDLQEVPILYEDDCEGTLQLRIDYIPDVRYIWQVCKPGSLVWETIRTEYSGICTISYPPHISEGVKVRCIIENAKGVIGYSHAYTIPQCEYIKTNDNFYDGNFRFVPDIVTVSMTDGMDSMDFTYYCRDLLARQGYSTDIKRGKKKFAIVAQKDGRSFLVICMSFNRLVSSYYIGYAKDDNNYFNCDTVMVITNNYFTPRARSFAEDDGIVLFDRDALDAMINGSENTFPKKEDALLADNEIKASVETQEHTYQFTSEPFQSPQEDAAHEMPPLSVTGSTEDKFIKFTNGWLAEYKYSSKSEKHRNI